MEVSPSSLSLSGSGGYDIFHHSEVSGGADGPAGLPSKGAESAPLLSPSCSPGVAQIGPVTLAFLSLLDKPSHDVCSAG